MKSRHFILLGLGTFTVLTGLYLLAFGLAVRQPLWPYHMRDIYLVKEHIAAETPSPRWLILGGSSALFGFEGDVLEKATGQPVVNLGFHAEFNLTMQLWQAERLARKGDTVILAEELIHYWPAHHKYTTFGTAEMGLIGLNYWWQAPLVDKYEMVASVPPPRIAAGLVSWAFRGSPVYQRRLAQRPPEFIWANMQARWAGRLPPRAQVFYDYVELNRHGDMGNVRVTQRHGSYDYGLEWYHPDGQIWRQLTEASARLRARGVRCVATWPPMERRSPAEFTDQAARANLAVLSAHLKVAGWPIVGKPEDNIFGVTSFYDTAYHLTSEGATVRTERLVKRLRAAGLVPPEKP